MPFYIRDSSICRFWYLQGSWNQSFTNTKGGLNLLTSDRGDDKMEVEGCVENITLGLAQLDINTMLTRNDMHVFTKHMIFVFLFSGHAVPLVGSQFPDQGSNPCPLQWKCRVTTGPPGKSQQTYLDFVHRQFNIFLYVLSVHFDLCIRICI